MADESPGDAPDDDGISDVEFAMKAHSSFEFFAKNVVDQEAFAGEEGIILKDFHLDWVDALDEHDRIAITAATGLGKTEVVGILYPIWKAFKNDDWRALIVAPSLDQSKMLLRRIKNHISNSEYLSHLKDEQENTWSTKKIELTNGSFIECKPYTENIKGAHVDYVICDEAAEYNPKETYHSAVKTRAYRRNGTVALISTPVHENDLVAELSEGHEIGSCPECGERLEKLNPTDHDVTDVTYRCSDHGDIDEPEYNENISEKGYWNNTYPALDDDDNPTFPEAFSYQDLMDIKQEDQESFVREYLCEAVAVEGDVFDPNDIINCYDGDRSFRQTTRDGCDYYLGADFAVSKQGDFSVFTVLEVPRDDSPPEIVWMERLNAVSLPEQTRRIEELHDIYDFKKIVIDSSNFGVTVLEKLKDRQLPVYGQSFELKARNNLIVNVKTTIERGDLIIPRNDNVSITRTLTDKLYDELIGFGSTETNKGQITYKSDAKHDDTVMSLGMALNAIEDTKSTDASIEFPNDQPRNVPDAVVEQQSDGPSVFY